MIITEQIVEIGVMFMLDKIIELLEDKINEAENYEEEELGKEFIEGYINGLKMAVNIVEDVIGYEEILKKATKENKMKEKINNQFEKVSNELGKTILGDMQEEFIGKKNDIVKHFEGEIEYCKKCIEAEDDEESERMKDVVDMIKEFLKELEKFEENDVIGAFIHPMDESLHLMEKAKLLEDLENWI